MLDLGYSQDRMLFYTSGEVADEVWDIFWYQYLGSANIDDQKELMRAHRDEEYDAKGALHEKYYPQTSAALLDHIDNFIQDIDKLLKKAETIGVSDPNSVYIRYEHARLPLIHKHNQFVKETFQNVCSRFSSDPEANWKEATIATVQEYECAIKECVQNSNGDWVCEGWLGRLHFGWK